MHLESRKPLSRTICGISGLATICLIAVLCSWPGSAWAAEVTLKWDESAGATGYEIEQSVDNGGTWAQVADLTTSVCAAGQCQHVLTAPGTGFVLFRFITKNGQGSAIRFNGGTWHCEDCGPPPTATNVGIQ